MSLLIYYQQENDIGVFRLSGKKTYANGLQAWKIFMVPLSDDNIRAILVFDESTSNNTSQEILNIAQDLMKIQFPKGKKVAIVVADNGKWDKNIFGESVMFIRGWKNIKIFTDEFEARKWVEPSRVDKDFTKSIP
jgi:hypothetical protein